MAPVQFCGTTGLFLDFFNKNELLVQQTNFSQPAYNGNEPGLRRRERFK